VEEKAMTTKLWTATLSVASLSLLLIGCGGSSSGAGASPSPSGVQSITVGTSPAILNVSLYYAVQSGIFAKNGLDVTPKVLASGEEATPLLLNGQIQLAASDPVGVITAISKNLPLLFVAAAGYPPTDPSKDIVWLMVKPSIKSAADLNGKTIAVNALGGNLQLAAMAAIDQAGGDSSSMKFVVMAIPAMNAAVQLGTVAAAVNSEPFVTAGKAAGLSNLLSVTATSEQGIPTVVYMTSKEYASSHPAVVQAFLKSLNAANADLAQDPAKVRSVAVTSTGAPASLVANINLPLFKSATITLDWLNRLQDLMIKYKLLTKKIDLSKYIVKP
jgi:NitT/TauT family transport system substrate-binding protein